jgi:hypothetical protein
MAEGMKSARARVTAAVGKMLPVPEGAYKRKHREQEIEAVVEALEDLAFEKFLMEFNKRSPRVIDALRRIGLFA